MVDTSEAAPGAVDRSEPVRAVPVFRTLLLVFAAAWFVILALPSTQGDPALGVPDLLHGLALGLALLAAAFIDWRGILGIG